MRLIHFKLTFQLFRPESLLCFYQLSLPDEFVSISYSPGLTRGYLHKTPSELVLLLSVLSSGTAFVFLSAFIAGRVFFFILTRGVTPGYYCLTLLVSLLQIQFSICQFFNLIFRYSNRYKPLFSNRALTDNRQPMQREPMRRAHLQSLLPDRSECILWYSAVRW